MKTVKMTLSAAQIAEKKTKLEAQIAKVSAVPGLESLVEELKAELAELTALEAKAAGVDKNAEFAKLFAGAVVVNVDSEGNVEALTEEQIKFIGEKLTVNIGADGKLTLAKKLSGGGGGTKAPSPYSKYKFDGVEFEKASELVKDVVEHLKDNGTTIKVSETNSMRREAVSLNKKFNLGIEVQLRETGEWVLLENSPFETAAKAETEEDETEEVNQPGE